MKHLLSTAIAAGLVLSASLTTTTVFAEDEINVLMFGMPFTNGLQELAEEFEAETGIKANIDVVGQDVFESRIALSFTGGTGDIDVVHTPVIQVQRWIQAGWLQPMTDMVSEATTSDILAGPLGAYSVDGKQWALPFFAGVGLMSYREDLLEAAGAEVPQTWEEMLDVAAKITTDDQAAIALRAVPGQGFNMFIFPMVMRAYGGAFFADYEGGDLTPAINSAENIEALDIYTKLINDYGPAGAGNFNFAEVNAAAQNGQIAFAIEGTGIISQIVDPAKSKYADVTGIALPPGGPAGRSPAIGVHGMGIPASASNAEAAAKFIEWAVSAETVSKIALSQSFPDFTTASVADNPEVVAKYASIHPDFLTTRVAALDLAIGHYRPLIPEWPALGQAIGESVNAAINGLMTSEEALEQAEADMRDILGL